MLKKTFEMPHKYERINADKLEWQEHMLEAGEIRIRVPNFGMHKTTREVILANIANGKQLDKVDYYFTAESIKEAMKVNSATTTNNTKTKKDASKDS
jgi:hypothetical protein